MPFTIKLELPGEGDACGDCPLIFMDGGNHTCTGFGDTEFFDEPIVLDTRRSDGGVLLEVIRCQPCRDAETS